MIDFNKIHSVPINRDFVLSKLSEEAIFYFYFGEPFKLGERYPSKFRKDRNPSTGFYINKSGKLTLNDLRDGEKHDCFSFVAKLNGITYGQAIRKVAEDFGLIESDNYKPLTSTTLARVEQFDKDYKKETLIQFEPDKWNDDYLSYWRLYEITKEELIRERVYPIKNLYLNKKKISNRDNDLRFAYVEEYNDKTCVKVYTPRSKSMKWISNIPIYVPFGLNSLQYKSNRVIITKSKKDLIVLRKFFPDVIATQNESESALTAELVELLTNNFDDRVIIWDADSTGVENCKKFNDKGFGYFNTPKIDYQRFKIKDVSDYVNYYGIEALEELLKQKNLI